MPAYHLRKPFSPRQLQGIAAATERKRIELGADLVVVRGLSGVMVATAMSLLHQTPIAVVRKPAEESHGNSVEMVDYMEGRWDKVKYNNWIIVDDLIDSGKTVNTILDTMRSYYESVEGDCVGIVLYHDDTPSNGWFNPAAGPEIPKFQLGRVTP